jgi:hypothetical protein
MKKSLILATSLFTLIAFAPLAKVWANGVARYEECLLDAEAEHFGKILDAKEKRDKMTQQCGRYAPESSDFLHCHYKLHDNYKNSVATADAILKMAKHRCIKL